VSQGEQHAYGVVKNGCIIAVKSFKGKEANGASGHVDLGHSSRHVAVHDFALRCRDITGFNTLSKTSRPRGRPGISTEWRLWFLWTADETLFHEFSIFFELKYVAFLHTSVKLVIVMMTFRPTHVEAITANGDRFGPVERSNRDLNRILTVERNSSGEDLLHGLRGLWLIFYWRMPIRKLEEPSNKNKSENNFISHGSSLILTMIDINACEGASGSCRWHNEAEMKALARE
jgi:hypothetical protein